MDIHLHHYIHNDAQDDIVQRLERIEDGLKNITLQGDILMALDAALAKRLDAATNAIAARQKKMQEQLDAAAKAGGLTAAQAAALAAELEDDIARLEEMGKDPANPIPA
jgi:hypothetical protein